MLQLSCPAGKRGFSGIAHHTLPALVPRKFEHKLNTLNLRFDLRCSLDKAVTFVEEAQHALAATQVFGVLGEI